MKPMRFGVVNNEKSGVIIEKEHHDASSFGEDYNKHFFETDGLHRLHHFVRSNQANLPKLPGDVRPGCPIAR